MYLHWYVNYGVDFVLQMYTASAMAVIGEFNITEILREAGPQVGEK
jgi:hypothetical protein